MLLYKVVLAKVILVSVIKNLQCFVLNVSSENYWINRESLLKSEKNRMIGGDIVLDDDEDIVNKILMKAKTNEIDNANNNAEFLPSQNFLLASKKIEQSSVFKIIQAMPKGAVLHAHSRAIVSADFMLYNITYRPNLYACDVNGTLKLKFFEKPTDDCHWMLLVDIRKNDSDIDAKIMKYLTMDKDYPTVDEAWRKFMSIFDFIRPIISYRPVFEDHIYQGLLEFYNDNILYAELRMTFPELYELDGTVINKMEAARIYKKAIDRFLQDYPDFVGVKLIYSPKRKLNEIKLMEHLEIFRQLKNELPDIILGFDLVGQEEKGEPLLQFAEKLRSLGNDVQLFFHAGETNWYGTGVDENLIDAVLLNTKRIGHGFALLKHPRLMELVREKEIAIEVSPISNQVLTLVKDLRNHPASALFADDYPVVVSNDDPGFWSAKGLSYDFYEAFVGIMSRHADLRALKKLALNSIKYSSMDEIQKKKAVINWNMRWKKFVEKLSR